MPRTPSTPVLLLLAATGGWCLARATPPQAHAADEPAEQAYRCRTFRHALDGDAPLDTHDRTSEVGQWVAEQRAGGWTLDEVDFEVASKPNGFPQGYVQLCLRR
ncbi:MAG: hypothetical protein H6732_07100 [Alphaproteobacteria bacterium]|nr:hypothetical protein [Alphaproteobacteria bacterium]